MTIRTALPADQDKILNLHLEAFGSEEGPAVANLVKELLADAPALSLVSEFSNKVIGHVLFTEASIAGSEIQGIYLLSPLAIAPSHQKQGIGKELVEYGITMLRELDAVLVLVLGDPKYYSRFGFQTQNKIKAPYELAYPEAWMALELKADALQVAKGTLQCATPFNAPEHW